MNTQHTPTPWVLAEEPWTFVTAYTRRCHINTAHDSPCGAGAIICSMPGSLAHDAAFIVRACNAHDDLVAALRILVEQNERGHVNSHGMTAARAALAKAGA